MPISGKKSDFLWRIFFIRSSRNGRILDGIGFFHAVAPLLKGTGGVKESPDELKRHLGYFNCNPLLAPFVISHIAQLEKRKASGDDSITEEVILRYKDTLSSSLTAIGDYFVEIILLPLALTIGCIFATYSSYFALVLFLAVYNFYHLRLRLGSSSLLLEQFSVAGREVLFSIVGEERFLEHTAAFVSGVFAAVIFSRAYARAQGGFVALGLAVTIATLLMKRRLSFTATILILFLALTIYLIV